MRGTCIVFFRCISVLLLIFLVNISSADTKCFASNNEKWNKNKQKCVLCADCPPGYYRNLTEPYTGRRGPNGAEQCLRCRQCPEGMYSENGQGVCIMCRVNCTEMKREYDEFCSSIHDAKCGSCLSGYEDVFRHTLFPCSPRKSIRMLKPPKKARDEQHNFNDQSNAEHTYPVLATRQNKGFSNGVPDGFVAVTCVAGVVLIVSVLVTSKYIHVRNRNRTRQNVASTQQGLYHSVNEMPRDDDIEVDAALQTDETVPKQYQPIRQKDPAAVRSGLESAARLIPISEISHPASTQHSNGIICLRLSVGNDVVCFERSKDICNCRTETRCQCQLFNFPVYNLEKSDEYICVVASEICHDPLPLFQHLGLDAHIIYQENDTRDRDPEKISEKELVIRLLHRWIEVKCTPNTLQQLSVALCKANFHNINNKIHDLRMNKM